MLGGTPTGSDGRPIVYGVRPEHFLLSDDGADAEVQLSNPPDRSCKSSPSWAARTSSQSSASVTNSSRATRSGSSQTRG